MDLGQLTRREALKVMLLTPPALKIFGSPNVQEQQDLLKRMEVQFYEFLKSKIFPKIEHEVNYIIQKGWADSISYDDLSHVHLCFPSYLPLKGTDEEKLQTMLDNYVLLYHSREFQPITRDRNIFSFPNGEIYTVNFHGIPDGRNYANVVVRGKLTTVFKPKQESGIAPGDFGYWGFDSINFEKKDYSIFDKLTAKPKKIFEGITLRFGI